MVNPYRLLGIGLCLAGAILSPVFYFIVGSVPFTAVSLSAIMLGFTSIALANARPYLSPEACQMLLATGMENTSALLEELGLRNKAVYLPSGSRDGVSQAIIPLVESGLKQSITNKLPGRLIVRYGKNPSDLAIAVTTPGNVSVRMLETKPGPIAEEMEASLTYILTGVLDIADSVSVRVVDSRVTVEVRGITMPAENMWYYHSLGSPVASIAAAIVSEALGKPVIISEEKLAKGSKSSTIVLEVLE